MSNQTTRLSLANLWAACNLAFGLLGLLLLCHVAP